MTSGDDTRAPALKTQTFRATWSFDGRGLPATDLPFWKEQLAAWHLIEVLAHEDVFWRQVDHMRAAQDRAATAWALARAGGTGRRRQVIQRLLLAAGEGEDCEAGMAAMNRTPIRFWVTTDDPAHGRRARYNLAGDFLALVIEGADLAVRRQVGRCFECDLPSDGGDYCRRHDGGEAGVWPKRKNHHKYVVDQVFAFVAPAILRGLPPLALVD
jgi:hypothetical protein